ncbi:MAG: Zn-dependent hydrolase, partial [Pseudomonadota bacterium]
MNWGEVAQRRLSEIAACSLEGDGVTRFPFTDEHRQALVHIRSWMHKAGLDPKLDAAATLVGHRSGTGPMVLMGSHQDTVRAAGKYDGIMGILIACLALEEIQHEGRDLPYPVQVLAFAAEEG